MRFTIFAPDLKTKNKTKLFRAAFFVHHSRPGNSNMYSQNFSGAVFGLHRAQVAGKSLPTREMYATDENWYIYHSVARHGGRRRAPRPLMVRPFLRLFSRLDSPPTANTTLYPTSLLPDTGPCVERRIFVRANPISLVCGIFPPLSLPRL